MVKYYWVQTAIDRRWEHGGASTRYGSCGQYLGLEEDVTQDEILPSLDRRSRAALSSRETPSKHHDHGEGCVKVPVRDQAMLAVFIHYRRRWLVVDLML